MPYLPTQQTFLGCSITGFNCSFEWTSGGTLTVGLVEDFKNFDELVTPAMGYPARFTYDSYTFDGIINDFSIKRGTGGNRTIEITLYNPAQILEGVQIIIGGYTGTVATLYNLYNIYGYLESFGFGNSRVNDSGMEWGLLTNTLQTMVLNYPIRFNGVPYFLDLSEIPTNIPSYYRLGGTSLSVAELVSDLCDTGGCDYFWDLVGNTIKLRTINRQQASGSGRIQAFLDENTEGQAVSTDIGYQVEYNTTGRFVAGGQVEKIYYRNNNLQDTRTMQPGEVGDYIANFHTASILPYFGLGIDGDVLLPYSIRYQWIFDNADPNFPATKRSTNFPDLWYVHSDALVGGGLSFPIGYPITIDQMRYALVGQKEWENYIVGWSKLTTNLFHNDFNPFFGLNDMLEIDAEVSTRIKDILANISDDKLRFLKPIDILNLDRLEKVLSVKGQRVYEFVRNIATEYFGRKFMVALPDVYVRIDTDTGIYHTSYELSDSGYVEESLFSNAANYGYIPYDFNFLTDEQNKIQAYVKFNGYQSAELNLTNLSPSDYSVSGNSVFIKCDIDPNFVYLNRRTATSPRAIITLPAPVYSTEYDIDMGSSVVGAIQAECLKRFGQVDLDLLQKLVQSIGFDSLRESIPGVPLIPAMAGIPVKSNTETYGPWYYTNSNGKIEYEQDNDLVPWNYGGYTQMNLVGTAKVTEAVSNRFVSEAGSIEVPGAPLCSTGAALISSGPYVTGISVTADGSGGVKTVYKFNSWNVKTGKLQRYNTERFKKITELQRAKRRQVRELFKPKTSILTSQVRLAPPTVPRRFKANSSHDVIMGETRTVDGVTDTTISIMPYYNAMEATQFTSQYLNKAGAGLDTIFRPYSTAVGATEMAHFETPEENATTPTVEDLNPLKTGHDMSITLRGVTRPDDIKNNGDAGGRSIALRGPLVLSGWGYDTSDKPVPNENPSSPTDEFADGYLTQSETWKTGPVDFRWDDDRKVWVTGSSVDVKEFTFHGSANTDFIGDNGTTTNGSGLAYISSTSSAAANLQYIADDATRNFLIRGDHVMCIKANGLWKILGENGLHRSAKTNTLISYTEAGNCKLIENDRVNVEVWFDHLGSMGDVIEASTNVEVRYVPGDQTWIIMGATCNE